MANPLENPLEKIRYRFAVSAEQERNALAFSSFVAGKIMRKLAHEMPKLEAIIPIKPCHKSIIYTFSELAERNTLPSLLTLPDGRFKEKIGNAILFSRKDMYVVDPSKKRTLLWYGAGILLREHPLPFILFFKMHAPTTPGIRCLLFPEFVTTSDQANRFFVNADNPPSPFSVLSSGQRIDAYWPSEKSDEEIGMNFKYFSPIVIDKHAPMYHLWITSDMRHFPDGNSRVPAVINLDPAPTPVGIQI